MKKCLLHLLKSFSSLKKKSFPWPPFSFSCYLITILPSQLSTSEFPFVHRSVASHRIAFGLSLLLLNLRDSVILTHLAVSAAFTFMTPASSWKLSLPLTFLNSHGCTVLVYFLVAPPSLFGDSSFST